VKFTAPAWLAVGLAACVLLTWLWRRYDARQRAALARFVAAHLSAQLTRSVSAARRRLARGLMLASLGLLCAALAGPLVGYQWELISSRGNDVVFAIDTSRSMSTPDIKPDRLTRAKLAVSDFVDHLDGDAVGIVAFAGTAFLVCPLTLDYGAFQETLGALDTHTVPRGGTNIAGAIREAQAALRRRPGADKILILVTDGEDLEGDALAAARAATAQDRLRIFTVGVGTAPGDLIPIPAEEGGGFVRDAAGVPVKSRLDAPALAAIATAAGGAYVPLGTEGQGLETIARTVLGSLGKHDLDSRRRRLDIPRYQWPLAASLALLLASLSIGTRRRGGGRAPAAAVVAASVVWAMPPAQADQTPDAKKPVVQFAAGAADYRAGRFPQAAQAFRESISRAPSADARRLADQQDAYYDLGNTLYRAGQKTEKSSPQETQQKWTEAVTAYETALQLRPDDADSRYNRDLVQRKLDALRQNQPPPSDPQGSKNPNPGGSGNSKEPPGSSQPPHGQPPAPPAPPTAAPPTAPHAAGGNPRSGAQAPAPMSEEEARELLDSAKGEEQHLPLARRRAAEPQPDVPYKNW